GWMEGVLQTAGTIERSRSPQAIDLPHWCGNFYFRLSRHFLPQDLAAEQRRQIRGPDWLMCGRVQRWRRQGRQMRNEVKPGFRDLGFIKDDLRRVCHRI